MLDLTKPVRTRNGRPVRIAWTDGGGTQPVMGAVWDEATGIWEEERWGLDGMYLENKHPASSDLINMPEKMRVHGFINVYRDGQPSRYIYPTKEEASQCGGRFACLEIDEEVEEGHGL